jgi:hypothetical protein
MNAKRKFQVFVILLLAQWYSRSGNGVCLTQVRRTAIRLMIPTETNLPLIC